MSVLGALAAIAQARAADTRQEFTELFDIYVPVAGTVFVLVAVSLVIAVLWRRRREPSHAPTRSRTELAYVVVLAIIASLLVWRTFDSMTEIDALAGPGPAAVDAFAAGRGPYHPTIRVVAAKWTWRFDYGRGVVEQGTGPGHYPTLVVPADTPVRFRMTSLDVVHALWISELRFKYDAYPRRTSVFDLVFRRGLTYKSNRCAEFCGEYHALMLFHVDVRSPSAFRAWLARRRAQVAQSGTTG